MHDYRFRLNECLRDSDIDAYLLQQDQISFTKQLEVSSHISKCCDCFERYYELRVFHQILKSELNKPISKQILDLVKEIQKFDT